MGNVERHAPLREMQRVHTNATIYSCIMVSYVSVQSNDNFVLAFTVVNTTAARVPRVGVATQIMETTRTAATAVSFIAHWGISSGDTSARVLCQNSRLRYSAKIRLITALPPAVAVPLAYLCHDTREGHAPGLRAEIAVHANKYDTKGP